MVCVVINECLTETASLWSEGGIIMTIEMERRPFLKQINCFQSYCPTSLW